MSSGNAENNSALENNNDAAVEQGESFASLLEKSTAAFGRLSPGQKVRAKVVSISGDLVYIDLGGKSEGTIGIEEFMGDDGVCKVNAGDEIDAFFVTARDGVRKLTTLVNGYSALSLSAIKDAFEGGIPVNGEVRREVKGGFEVSVSGVRCFCPFSQIDLKGGREGGIFLGRTFPFKVIEYEGNGKNIILSRRSLLEEEKRAKIEKLRETLSVGMEVTGTVRALQNFGAFVDLGGLDGLIPVSEMSWDRSERPGDIVSVGKPVTAKIITLDWDSNRLTLSIKATKPDPWNGVPERYVVGSRVSGTIVRLAPFGVFVNLEPGIDGLIHISNLGAGRRINHPKEVVETGQQVETYVLSVDTQSRKISLSMQPKVEPKKVVLPQVGEVADVVVDKVMPFGVFVKLSDGLSGLIPNSELGAGAGSDPKRIFPSGMEMQAMVTDVDTLTNKIRLSRKALTEKAAKDEYTEYVDSTKQASVPSSGGLGSLGELLKAKMEEKKQAS